jgi:20S proteasome alpha/beta subunit
MIFPTLSSAQMAETFKYDHPLSSGFHCTVDRWNVDVPQVEYATKAVENGGQTAIGLRCTDGVILAVEKLIQSKLLVPGSNKRITTVDRHVGIVRLYIPKSYAGC